jgi:hypothetical protein
MVCFNLGSDERQLAIQWTGVLGETLCFLQVGFVLLFSPTKSCANCAINSQGESAMVSFVRNPRSKLQRIATVHLLIAFVGSAALTAMAQVQPPPGQATPGSPTQVQPPPGQATGSFDQFIMNYEKYMHDEANRFTDFVKWAVEVAMWLAGITVGILGVFGGITIANVRKLANSMITNTAKQIIDGEVDRATKEIKSGMTNFQETMNSTMTNFQGTITRFQGTSPVR